MLTFIIFFLSYQSSIQFKAEGIQWDLMYKTDYAVIPHRIEVIYFNESYGKLHRCELVKYNRTSLRTLNVSGTLTKPFDGKRLVAKLQVYKFLSNTYKFFPITVDINVCQEYERNSFDWKSNVNRYTNVRSCPPKLGPLYAAYAPLDSPKLPPLIPKGDYKDKIEVFSRDDMVLHLELYGSVVEQPRKLK